MSSTDEFVSVVIPARDASASLPECLLALRVQTYPRDRYEVIVVDDGSRDNTASVAETFWARVVRIPPSGPAAARNRGVQAARGTLLLFTDADCAPGPDWIRRLTDALRDGDAVAAKGTYRTDQTSWTAQWVQAEYQSRYRIMRRAASIDFIDTYSAAYRREAFEDAGGFDESFPTACVEDQELSFRLAERGARMVFCPDAVVGHRHAADPLSYLRKKFKIGYWKMKVIGRYPGKAVSDTHTPSSLKGEVASLAAFVASLVPAALLSGLAWLPLVPAAAFAAFSAPMVRGLLRIRPALAALAPAFLTLRALGLGAGMVRGLLGEPFRSRSVETRMEPASTPAAPAAFVEEPVEEPVEEHA